MSNLVPRTERVEVKVYREKAFCECGGELVTFRTDTFSNSAGSASRSTNRCTGCDGVFVTDLPYPRLVHVEEKQG